MKNPEKFRQNPRDSAPTRTIPAIEIFLGKCDPKNIIDSKMDICCIFHKKNDA